MEWVLDIQWFINTIFSMCPLILKFYYLSFAGTAMNKEGNKLTTQICDNL